MKKQLVGFALACLPLSGFAAVPDNGNPVTFLGPTAQFGLTQTTSMASAYSLQAELGTSNIRLDGTLGFLFDENQRLKVSAEYLAQNITYGYASGDTSQWRPQAALGANYMYAFGKYMYVMDPAIGVGAFVAHTPNKRLRTNRGTYVNAVGTTVAYTDVTRVSGANAYGLSPGFYLHPWLGAITGIDVNYDQINYNDTFLPSENPKGFGATVNYAQMLSDNVTVNLSAGRRQPFNHYQARIAWSELPFFGLWTVGFNGEYTIGKDRLPSTYNLGVSFDYFIDKSRGNTSFSQREDTLTFLQDTATSAAHMPMVFGARDELFS